jgi:hypothetical protein
MAMRCLYCGEGSWRPFRWLRDQEFCSSKHRDLYRVRLQRVVGELTKYEDLSAEAPRADAPNTSPQSFESVSAEVPLAEMAQARMAPAIVLHDPAMAQELTEVLGLTNQPTTTVWLPPDVFPMGLRPREGRTNSPISPCVPPVTASGSRAPVSSLPAVLPATFENHVQIKRWGLKIQFHKV